MKNKILLALAFINLSLGTTGIFLINVRLMELDYTNLTIYICAFIAGLILLYAHDKESL